MRTKWHYTTGDCWRRIVATGVLRCQARAKGEAPYPDYAGDPLQQGGPPTIWFSTEQFWEPTAEKAMLYDDGTIRRLAMAETYEKAGGLVRIAVARELYPWEDYVRYLKPEFAAELRRRARKAGANTKHHWCSYEPIPSNSPASKYSTDGTG
jgi:hypothetical protein